MRISDLLHFLRQIFFPNWKPKEIDENDEPSRLTVWAESVGKRLRSKENAGTLVSVLFHVLFLFLLSLFLLPDIRRDGLGDILSGFNEMPKEFAEIDHGEASVTVEVSRQPHDDPTSQPDVEQPKPEPMNNNSFSDSQSAAVEAIPDSGDIDTAPDSKRRGDLTPGGGYEGRTPEGRSRIGPLGGNGENSVEAGLAWLARHQNRDGSWSFDIKCCSNGGSHTSRVAATSLALLPFLGAGYTHERPEKYRKTVEAGLVFLLNRGALSELTNTFDYRDGLQAMYSHGLATIVLCEAHAMSRNKSPRLRETAQGAIDFIERAQDQRFGGWRYNPNDSPGDLAVTAWQVMALKSAKLADLHVSQQAIYWASDFLDDAAIDGGRQYLYQAEPKRLRSRNSDSQRTSNATGLLLRMYLGWEPGEKMLDEGMEIIGRFGPLRPGGNDCCLYYAYYATLAMHHHDNPGWNRWAAELSEFLVRTQAQSGHESGSWFFPDRHDPETDEMILNTSAAGGRLLNTSLALLILETPYRILPLYRNIR